ncbi:hypothetical protein AGOR_G00207410 [Albula goreensis]|uniref:TNFR-Cys domain-containing protein n=1 Tax=Albula goreensis TaxID=1534307 RepID=A0A8T3CKW0_9TELE|nr:hypothetical protein AGOR_G00207410 [Albula goreensis]
MTTEPQCREGEILHEKRCCKLCPKGHYVQSACQGSTPTVCQPCPHGHYTEEANFLFKCLPCRPCHSGSHLMLTGECRADQNRQCKCVEGYFCEDRKCGHCRSVKICPSGSGVTHQPTVWKDTVCNNCPEGTYNNVSDSKTPCQPHTNCEAQGLQFRSHGTRHSDAVCAFIEKESTCPWVLPAFLWVGLCLTVLIIGCLYLYWRFKRHSKRRVNKLDLPMSEAVLNLPNLIPEPYQERCFDERHTICNDGNHCNLHFPSAGAEKNSSLSTTEAIPEVYQPMKSMDLQCDGAEVSAHMSTGCFNESAARGGERLNFAPSLGYSQPQEDEWSGS